MHHVGSSMADIHSAKFTACSINYVCTLKYHLLNLRKKIYSTVHVVLEKKKKKKQLYLCIFLFYLTIGLNGHILARCNLILMRLGESGSQDFSAVR